MKISIETLERLFDNFTDFVSTKDNKPFSDFKSSQFIDTAENYKYQFTMKQEKTLGVVKTRRYWGNLKCRKFSNKARVTHDLFRAYLFFIKDRNQFMPISQTKFEEIFEIIGSTDFKTSHNLSWENNTTYIDIIKQTRKFLKTKDNNTTLLDAQSFLCIICNQMKNVVEVTTTKAKAINKNFENYGKQRYFCKSI